MKLMLDLGNTCLNWARADSGHWQTGGFAHTDGMDQNLDRLWLDWPSPETIGIACVAGPQTRDRLERWLERQWGCPLVWIRAKQKQCGVINQYREPVQLGADRWAALVAARKQTGEPVCVIDCGTAVTVDAIDGNGLYLGGTIFPGLELLRESLSQGTAVIEQSMGDETSCQATTTEDGVAAGTAFGLAGAITRFVAEHGKVLGGNMEIIITGGSADIMIPRLPFKISLVPDLVLRGVAVIVDSGYGG